MGAETIFEGIAGRQISTYADLRGRDKVAREVTLGRFFPFGKDYVSPADKLAEGAAVESGLRMEDSIDFKA